MYFDKLRLVLCQDNDKYTAESLHTPVKKVIVSMSRQSIEVDEKGVSRLVL